MSTEILWNWKIRSDIIAFGNNFAKGENFVTKATGNYFPALNNVVNVFNDQLFWILKKQDKQTAMFYDLIQL